MKKIFLIAGLLAVSGNLAAFGQDHSAQTAEDIAAKQELERLKPKLEEYRQGKRDAHDGYVIMFRMLMDYGRLKEGETPEARALLNEFNLFKKRHPEAQRSVSWVVHSGTMSIIKNNPYTGGENARREAEEKEGQDMAEKRKNFVPTDQSSIGYAYYQNNMALIHQYRIDFFHNVSPAEEKHGIKSSVKPSKSVAFKEALRIKLPFQNKGPAILVCTDPLLDYLPGTPKEQEILGPQGGIHWRNPNGQYHDFCGIINLDGTIVARIPGEWNLPTYTRPLGILSDGKEALLGVGHWGVVPVDPKKTYDGVDRVDAMVYQYLILWRYPNKIEKFRIGALSADKFNALRDKFRVNMLNQDAYEHEIK